MKTPFVRHGEVVLKEIKSLPEDAVLQSEEQSIVVAHSETGHHHVLETLDMSKIKVFTLKGDTYVEVPEIAKLWHQKSGVDKHKEHKIAPAIYKIILKKEFDYFEGAMRTVRD